MPKDWYTDKQTKRRKISKRKSVAKEYTASDDYWHTNRQVQRLLDEIRDEKFFETVGADGRARGTIHR